MCADVCRAVLCREMCRRALASLAAAAEGAGHPEWGYAGPHDSGGYNSLPLETAFFKPHGGSWDTGVCMLEMWGLSRGSCKGRVVHFPPRGQLSCYQQPLSTCCHDVRILCQHPAADSPAVAACRCLTPPCLLRLLLCPPRPTYTHTPDYGNFFLSWYSSCLLQHGERLLQLANQAFAPFR